MIRLWRQSSDDVRAQIHNYQLWRQSSVTNQLWRQSLVTYQLWRQSLVTYQLWRFHSFHLRLPHCLRCTCNSQHLISWRWRSPVHGTPRLFFPNWTGRHFCSFHRTHRFRPCRHIQSWSRQLSCVSSAPALTTWLYTRLWRCLPRTQFDFVIWIVHRKLKCNVFINTDIMSYNNVITKQWYTTMSWNNVIHSIYNNIFNVMQQGHTTLQCAPSSFNNDLYTNVIQRCHSTKSYTQYLLTSSIWRNPSEPVLLASESRTIEEPTLIGHCGKFVTCLYHSCCSLLLLITNE